ncbi:right-handed parallel beta-helix repeat-containing protein [Streptomyces clavuligerus]|uniref:Plastocyanin n=1 Tax=Streptomyces clavuligerus TaxID=1901 RepID=D5SLS0_STRCL|nr:right-handed parallel beta-helix repeat-containing protein [Streptomyces clavuligerus]EFG04863.1 plastocyanin [Streptomyces clavuligerus]MBY6306696.1 right-handed parallel beta-helix repeat-containing protein [Streptomyces clavuligerus]QCS10697.1 plasmid stabilization protein [Streptomyces clavuligerus]QPJ97266.1 plasmid stabilization protein [Streptomyces clavuligerus]WDN57410.1 right-handed parallel beta-helix repeat-containing protein [Streptomyces clavuligerus]
MSRWALRTTAAVLGALTLMAGCSGGSGGDGDGSDKGRRPDGAKVTIRVPGDAPTISAAVSLARPGDLVLVAPGVYHESVRVDTARITLRGESRQKVVIDGQLRRPNGVVVTAPGVAVENLTVRRNTQNGVLVTGSAAAVTGLPGSGGYDTGDEPVRFLKSFLVSHVTATRNGLYGIYAFSAQNGVIEHSYTSGGADSGIYVGQCRPCRIVVRDNVSELNAVGYENTNAGGDLYVVGNRLVGNRVGLTTNSDHQEKLLPQRDTVVAGNLIADNQQPRTPEQADGGWGIGIGIDGGSENRFIRNRITGNTTVGLMITATADLTADRNRITENTFTANGVDVGWTFSTATRGRGNCLRGNTLRTTVPAGLADSAACPVPATAPTPSGTWRSPTAPAGIPFTDVAAPGPQPQLPRATTTGATVVPDVPALPDTADIRLPSPSLLAAGARVRTS